ncbi:AMP-binding domain-containing protein [Pyricularia oryzae 70-15]|uniref:AMP-binding domain-containing protein n=3 Tax=Pyricularia oryzae TaxID=318829 RepID=G4MUN7_PYRO7|nr:AMP-binding domain-containing protein [Pyricularia oryzae 70-15]EHA54010.1 AMP-binding domain-containing protein [Pyricularia oryzae 70-15]ELQ44440.1 AMP-dependent synthetase and ligase [Pyricularia oryzae Y34]KAI7922650.1 AMP-binding domain-containing protein [Pyricularia oryzae]KAI7932466.1 AMP-binding domain-containing protein [Pyricularia oryzae]
MSGPPSRLKAVLGHLGLANAGAEATQGTGRPNHLHALSPTLFLQRAAAIEPEAEAVVHVTANGRTLRRSYAELADRARGLAYYLAKKGFFRVGILAPNTPAFLESIYGVNASGGVIVPVNYRLKQEDIAYIFEFANVDAIIVDAEFVGLLELYQKDHVNVPLIIDTDTDATEGELSGPFDECIAQGLQHDREAGGKGWDGLCQQPNDEDDIIAIPFTSGTTSKPKGVEYTHRGAYLAALANIVESGLNYNVGRCKYLWTLPMFHAVGWTFPWAVTAVRGTHVCLRKIDYPLIWRLLTGERVTHFNAAPTVCTLLCAADEAQRLPDPPVRVTVAASPPTAHLFRQMTELNLSPVHVYGMTETYGPITKGYHMPAWETLPEADKFARMARQGHGFLTSLPIRIVKPEEAENGVLIDVAKDGVEIGEIVFAGNICAKGYYNDPEATKKMFAGGVLHSGDLAVWHPDGSAQILDRQKDIIISGGENISSVALESMLVQHPDVLEAGVVAVPDSHWGERPKAYVTVRRSKEAGMEPLTGQGLIDWAKHQSAISKFMIPREVEIVDELPKTSTGKIKKNELREWAKHGKSSLE